MDDEEESKKCKGINKTVTKNNIVFENYKDVLFNRTSQMRKMNVIRSYKHEIYTGGQQGCTKQRRRQADSNERQNSDFGIWTLQGSKSSHRLGFGKLTMRVLAQKKK